MKKILSAILVLAMMASLLVVFGACNKEEDDDFKVGFICLHDENSTYDKNFLDAASEVKAALGLTDEQVVIKTQVPEGQECYEAAKELAGMGCDVVFANSFGHEDYMIQAAEEFPDVEFCHATGTKAHTEKLPNFHNAFASIYEGRYLVGIVAGMKLNEMIAAGTITADQAKMGYVGAMPYAEVKSGLTAFYLGAKSVCPTVTMDVKYTNDWYHPTKEQEAANALMDGGCVLISQHADSMGAPNACEARNVPNVSYNASTISACPNTALISSRINWAPYFKYMIEQAQKGETIVTDYTGSIKDGSVALTELNAAIAAEGTQAAIDAAKQGLIDGTIKVFNTANFTVGGETLTTYLADVDTDETWQGETEVIAEGYFHESEYRSAPYFDIDIDGITTIE